MIKFRSLTLVILGQLLYLAAPLSLSQASSVKLLSEDFILPSDFNLKSVHAATAIQINKEKILVAFYGKDEEMKHIPEKNSSIWLSHGHKNGDNYTWTKAECVLRPKMLQDKFQIRDDNSPMDCFNPVFF